MPANLSGQLWFETTGSNGADRRVGYLNANSTSPNTVDATSAGDGFTALYALKIDTAAGLYFVMDHGVLKVGHLNGAGAPATPSAWTTFQASIQSEINSQNTFVSDDALQMAGIAIDTTNHKLYVAVYSTNQAHDGFVQFDYNPLTGAVSGGTYAVTGLFNKTGHYVAQDVIYANNQLFYVDQAQGGVIENALWRVDLSTGNVSRVVAAAQFPEAAGAGRTGGDIWSVAYDTRGTASTADDLIYFTTKDETAQGGPAAAIWKISASATNGTATKVGGLTPGLQAGGNLWTPGRITVDDVSHELYVSDQHTGSANILRIALSADGGTATSVTPVNLGFATTSDAYAMGLDFDSLPTLSLTGTGTHIGEQGALVDLTATLSISDVDNAYLAGATVQVTGGTFSANESSSSDDHLSYGASGQISGTVAGTNITLSWNAATETLTLSGYDTLANYQAVLNDIRFNATGDNPTNYGGNAGRTITWTVSDGAVNIPAGSQNSGTSSITIDASDDAPVLGGGGSSTTYVEGGAAAQLSVGLTVTDADNLSLSGATVAITAGRTAGDVLNFTSQNGITGSYDAATGTLTLSGGATLANYQAALRSVTFSSNSDDPTAGGNTSRTITYTASDGSLSSAGVTATVNVTAVNDRPSLSGAGNTISYTEHQAGQAIAPALVAADVDNASLSGATVTISAGLTAGDVLGFTNQNGISGSYNAGTGVLTLTGSASLTDYQAALRSIVFSNSGDDPTAGGHASRTITFVVTDGTDSSTGVTSTINVTDPTQTGTGGPDTLTGTALNDSLNGAGGNDTLYGQEADDALDGGDGNDTLYGGPGADRLGGMAGADTMYGGSGDDIYSVENAGDVVSEESTGAGVDDGGIDKVTAKVSFTLGNFLENLTLMDASDIDGTGNGLANAIYGNDGVNHLSGLGGADQIFGRGGNDVIFGGSENDRVEGDTGDDEVHGGTGNDTVRGNDGNDVLEGGDGDDTIEGGADVDTVTYVSATSAVTVTLATGVAQNTGGAGTDVIKTVENLTGSNWNDTLTGSAGDNLLSGGLGADTLQGGLGDDTLDGGDGVDTASYEAAAAAVTASLAAHQATGGAGTDTLTAIENLTGSKYNDTLTGDGGANAIQGGAGGDLIEGGGGADLLDGGIGVDTVSYAGAASGVSVSLDLTAAQDTLGAGQDTVIGFENLTGSDHDDTLSGNAGGNVIDGGAGTDTVSYASAAGAVNVSLDITTVQSTGAGGKDTLLNLENLSGSSFDDKLNGDGGANVLNGGAGRDILAGGGGADTFVFSALSEINSDQINDFASGDLIDLLGVDADTVTAGNQAFHLGATAGHTGDIVVSYDQVHDRTVLKLYTDGDATADATIYVLGSHTDLTAGDFVL